jgi:hypothetical protein
VSTIIKQYGLMRSGTCYTQAFIHQNFENVTVVPNVLGWKHGPYRPEPTLDGKSWLGSWNKPNRHVLKGMHSRRFVQKIIDAFVDGKLRYIVTVRNPYTWLIALARYKGVTLTLSQIKQRLEHWNQAHLQWLKEIPEPVCFMQYETLRDAPGRGLALIAMDLGIEPKMRMRVPRLYVAPGADHGRVFHQKPYAKVWNAKMLNVANSVLDRTLMDAFEYSIMENPVR